MPADRKKLKELVARINRTSNADFVRRLLDEKRKVLKNDDGTVSTHELGYVTEDGGAVVFPSVQSVGDSLARFPYPESYERAVERGDTVHMSIPDAELFTVGYKDYYPGFDKYSDGGTIHIKPSHRGRLTELKERTGKTEAELYSDGNPAHKKMVVFARNARKWSHADGGFLTDYPDSGTIIPVMPGNYTGDTDFVKRYAGGGDMVQIMGAVGPEYMSSLANSVPAYPAVETVNVNPSQEDETQVWQIPQYGHVPEHHQPAAIPPAVEPAPAEEPVFDPTAVQAEYDSMLDNILLRQRYAESGFNDRAVNKSSGAAGAYQIMPIAYKDYLQRGRGKEGDLMNAAYNRLVRDHVIKMAPRDLGKEFYTDRDTALERHAKEMAVFNAGGGTVRKALRKAVNAGMDITSSFDWLQFLPKETRDYVNFIVLGQEIENSGKNEEAYQAALEKFNNRHDLGGLVSRINKAYGGDRKKMSDAIWRIKTANKFDSGGDKDGDKYVEETDPNFIGPVLPTYSGGNMNAAVASASLPSIQTAHGKRIAHNMAKRVVAGQMQMGQVPRSYRSYVEGEAKGAIPMTDFMNTAGKYVAAGTAATVAAPWLLSLAATAPAAIGTELGTYGNIYGNLARTMLLDVPAFEAADRIPTLWGGNRLTVHGGDLAERGYRAVMPESGFTDATAPLVNQAGQFATGFPVGIAGHWLMQNMYGALRPVDNFIYSRRLMDNYSKERLAADEAGDTESIKSIDALITKGASKGDITGLSYYRGNEPGDLGSTASVMSKIGFDSKRLAPGHRLSLIGDYDLSKDSYPLLQRVLLRNQRNGVGDIRLVTDNGVPRMIKLNSDGTGKGSLSAIDKGIDMLRTELGNPDIPGRVSLFGTHYVPAIEFYKYPIPAQ